MWFSGIFNHFFAELWVELCLLAISGLFVMARGWGIRKMAGSSSAGGAQVYTGNCSSPAGNA